MESNELLGGFDPEIQAVLTSRREALRRAGRLGATFTLASLPLGLGALAKSAFAQGGLPQEIVDVLNFALTLEYLENEYYIAGLGASGLIPAADRPIFEMIQQHEQAHVTFLEQQLGAAAIDKPAFDFTAGGMFAPFSDYSQFKLLAQAFEDTGVRAYKGQAGNLIGNDVVLQAALTIHSVEARHAARVRRLNGLQGWIPFSQPGVPAAAAPIYAGEGQTVQLGVDVPNVSGVGAESVTEAFDEPLTKDEVLAIAGPFIA